MNLALSPSDPWHLRRHKRKVAVCNPPASIGVDRKQWSNVVSAPNLLRLIGAEHPKPIPRRLPLPWGRLFLELGVGVNGAALAVDRVELLQQFVAVLGRAFGGGADGIELCRVLL